MLGGVRLFVLVLLLVLVRVVVVHFCWCVVVVVHRVVRGWGVCQLCMERRFRRLVLFEVGWYLGTVLGDVGGYLPSCIDFGSRLYFIN